ncbi:hypothetical protein [Cellulomonas massiliensis]|uniref:hypothetical protein n=1 Tax=Cellulomonas massiliensis TaxID=1465811 RepID=UPI00030B32AB|nr:hypothetical protein [Cellulomonas massiliensis]
MKGIRAMALVCATAATVAACDPGLPTAGLALVHDRDGGVVVVVQACEEFTAIELGPGDDFWGKETVVLQTGEPERHARIDLDDAEEWSFGTGSATTLGALRAPFFARVVAPEGGVVEVAAFDRTPEPGRALAVQPSEDPPLVDVPAGDLADLLAEACASR